MQICYDKNVKYAITKNENYATIKMKNNLQQKCKICYYKNVKYATTKM